MVKRMESVMRVGESESFGSTVTSTKQYMLSLLYISTSVNRVP